MNARTAIDWHERTQSAWSMMDGVEEFLSRHEKSTPLTRTLLQQLAKAKEEMGSWTLSASKSAWEERVARAWDLMGAALNTVIELDRPGVAYRSMASPGFSTVRDEILGVVVRIRRVRGGEAA